MPRFGRATILAVLLVNGAAADPQFIASEASDDTALQVFLLDPFEKPLGYSLLNGNAIESVRSRFGEPTNIGVSHEVDREARAAGEIRLSTWKFDGLEITVAERPGEKRSWLRQISISGPNHQLKYGIGIGSSRKAVFAALQPERFINKPARLRVFGSVWEKGYRQVESSDVQVSADVTLEFDFDENDKVRRITWSSGDD